MMKHTEDTTRQVSGPDTRSIIATLAALYRNHPGLLVLVISIILCMLTYSGRLHSADEIAVYALSLNMAQRGSLDINVIASTEPGMSAPPFSGVGQFGNDGNFYSGKGILPSLLALPLIRFALWTPNVDPVAASLVLNVLLTGFTALLITAYVHGLYDDYRTAFWMGILYVAGTMALAYAKRLFTEPAAAFFVVLSYFLLTQKRNTPHSFLRHLMGGFCMGCAVAASYSNAVLIPCFVLLVVYIERTSHASFRQIAVTIALFVLGLLPSLIGLGWYNYVRFGDVLQNGLPLIAWSLPYLTPQAAIIRFIALLISPYRGLLWYMPLMLLLPWVILRTRRRASAFSPPQVQRYMQSGLAMAVGCTLCYLVFFSLWSMWWGGFNWGPRFLLPVIPLWMIALAPAFLQNTPSAHNHRDRAGITLKVSIVLLSIAVAAVGGLSDTFRSEGALAMNGRLSALVSPRTFSDTPLLTDVAYFQGISGLDLITKGVFDVWWQNKPVDVDANLDRALHDVAEHTTAESVVLFLAPERVEAFLHAYRLPLPIVGIAPDQSSSALFKQVLTSRYSRIALLTDEGQTDTHNAVERAVETSAFRSRNEYYNDWRVAVFGRSWDITTSITTSVMYDGGLTLQSLEYSARVKRGQVVTIAVQWMRTLTAQLEGVKWYAHLIAADGTLVSQHDALVGDGYGWAGQNEIVEHRGILVPIGAATGTYTVNIGAYSDQSARIKTVVDGEFVHDDVLTFTIQVD